MVDEVLLQLLGKSVLSIIKLEKSSVIYLQLTLRKNCLSKLIFQFVGIRSPKEMSVNSISNSRSTKRCLRDALEGIFKHKIAFVLPRKPASFVCIPYFSCTRFDNFEEMISFPKRIFKTIQDFDCRLHKKRKR